MKVIATETGFYNKRRIYPGEVFEFAGEKCGKWFAPVDSVAAKGKDEVKNDDGPTRKEMMVQLDQDGVKYDKNMNKMMIATEYQDNKLLTFASKSK